MSLFDDVDDFPYQSPPDTFRARIHEVYGEMRAGILAAVDELEADPDPDPDVTHRTVMVLLGFLVPFTPQQIDAWVDADLDAIERGCE